MKKDVLDTLGEIGKRGEDLLGMLREGNNTDEEIQARVVVSPEITEEVVDTTAVN